MNEAQTRRYAEALGVRFAYSTMDAPTYIYVITNPCIKEVPTKV